MARRLTCASLLALAFMRRCRAAQDFGVRLCKTAQQYSILYSSEDWPHLFCSVSTSCLFFALCSHSFSCFLIFLISLSYLEAFQARHVLVKDLAKAAQVPVASGIHGYPHVLFLILHCFQHACCRVVPCSLQAMRMSVEHLDRPVAFEFKCADLARFECDAEALCSLCSL